MFFSDMARTVSSTTMPAGARPGALRRNNVAAVWVREAFRHLAAAAVADADKEHPLSFATAHSLERNSSWTRESEPSSG